MTILSQNDPRWKNVKLGFSNTTIGNYGCTITSLAMILSTTPDVVNEKLKAVNGFAPNNPQSPENTKNLVIWAKLEEAFPGIRVRRIYAYNNDDVRANVPYVLVEVDGKPIGGYRHWVVYVGGGKLYDPWDGKEGPTSEYPNPVSYCVISGSWIKPVDSSNNQCEIDRDTNWNVANKVTSELGVSLDPNNKMGSAELAVQRIKNLNQSIADRDIDISKKTKALIDQGELLKTLSEQAEMIPELVSEREEFEFENDQLKEQLKNTQTVADEWKNAYEELYKKPLVQAFKIIIHFFNGDKYK